LRFFEEKQVKTISSAYISSQQWQECERRALLGSVYEVAAQTIAAKQFGISLLPAIQRTYGPIMDSSSRWASGYQLRPGLYALDPAIEDLVRAAARLGRATGEAQYDGLTVEQMWQEISTNADWYRKTTSRVREVLTVITSEASLMAICARDLLTQAQQLKDSECRLITLSTEGTRAFEEEWKRCSSV
jgi:hypothetical protein